MTLTSKILITGAGGLIGNAVCNSLQKEQQSFIGLYKSKPANNALCQTAFADIEKDDLQKILGSESISAIIHCAAAIPNEQYSISDCYNINTTIDKKIAEYATKNSIEKLIFISTTNMYGVSNEVIDENTKLNIDNLYSQAKLNSEQLFFKLINIKAVVSLRVNAPYYYSQKANTVLKIFINKIVKGKDVLYHGTGVRQQDFTHVKDIADAVMCSLKSDKTGIYNIASGNSISMKNLAELILSKVPGSKSRIFPSGMPDAQENHKALFNIRKAKKDLRWQPKIKLGEGIEEWVKYLNNVDRNFF